MNIQVTSGFNRLDDVWMLNICSAWSAGGCRCCTLPILTVDITGLCSERRGRNFFPWCCSAPTPNQPPSQRWIFAWGCPFPPECRGSLVGDVSLVRLPARDKSNTAEHLSTGTNPLWLIEVMSMCFIYHQFMWELVQCVMLTFQSVLSSGTGVVCCTSTSKTDFTSRQRVQGLLNTH